MEDHAVAEIRNVIETAVEQNQNRGESVVKGITSIPEWKTYLSQFTVENLSRVCFPKHADTRKHAVLIEFSCHPYLIPVFCNFASILAPEGWAFTIVHDSANEEYIRSRLSPQLCSTVHLHNADVSRQLRELQDPQDLKHIHKFRNNPFIFIYNKMMTTSSFWQWLRDMNCEHVLIYQTDTVLLKGELDEFTQYDYVGAPWQAKLAVNNYKTSVGNGGLSLRSVEAMLRVNSKHKWKYECEDVYHASHLTLDEEEAFNVAPFEVAGQFSMETVVLCEYPRGMHRPSPHALTVENIRKALRHEPLQVDPASLVRRSRTHADVSQESCDSVRSPTVECKYFDWQVYARDAREKGLPAISTFHQAAYHLVKAQEPCVAADDETPRKVNAYIARPDSTCEVVDCMLYMKRYPDVAARCKNTPNVVCALGHWLLHGKREGRGIFVSDLMPQLGLVSVHRSRRTCLEKQRVNYILCRPCGGLNDMLNQVAWCLSEAEMRKYVLIVDTQHSQSMFPLAFGQVFQVCNTYVRVEHAVDDEKIAFLNRMPAFPARYQHTLDSNTFNGKDNGFDLSSALSCDTFLNNVAQYQHVVVHWRSGGGSKSCKLIQNYCLRVCEQFFEVHRSRWDTLAANVQRVKPYEALHVRNTDLKTPSYVDFVRKWIAQHGHDQSTYAVNTLVVCTDSQDVLETCKSLFENQTSVRLLSADDMSGTRQTFGVSSGPIHYRMRSEKHCLARDAVDMYVFDLLRDLFVMSESCVLHTLNPEGRQRHAGFSALAECLQSNKDVRQFFFRHKDATSIF